MPVAPGPERRWRLCVNADVDRVHRAWLELQEDATLRVLVWQKERGEETEHLHLQAYVEFKRAVRRNWVKRFLGFEGDVRTCDASREANREYVTKEDTRVEGPFEIGTWGRRQGARTDLAALKASIQDGADDPTLGEVRIPL